MYDLGAWFLRVIMSSSMYNKTIIGFGVWDIHNNQGLGKGYEAFADIPYLDLDYSRYHKNLIQ